MGKNRRVIVSSNNLNGDLRGRDISAAWIDEAADRAVRMCNASCSAISKRDKLIAEQQAEIERLKSEHEDSLRRAKDNAVSLSGTVTEYAGELLAKNKLIEQMKNCYNCKFKLHAAKECETCNTADCDDSYLYETSSWQPKEPEAAEGGEE